MLDGRDLLPVEIEQIKDCAAALVGELLGAEVLDPACDQCSPVLEAVGSDATQDELTALGHDLDTYERALDGYSVRTAVKLLD